MSILNQTKMTLKERLSLHVGFSVVLQAKEFTSESGLLQRVGTQFMKINNQYFVPSTMFQISLLGFAPNVSGELVHIRSSTRGSFTARLVRTGSDFIELFVAGSSSAKVDWLLIPLNKIISLEKV